MADVSRLFRSTVVLAAGHLASYGLSFLRNVILARTLSKADFGLAAIFSVTVTMLEIAGRMSFGQQIVQSKRSDLTEFEAASHAFQFALSVAGGGLILALSRPIAASMDVPHLAWAFAALALVPLARGLEHLDNYRRQRDLEFMPSVLSEFIPQLVVTAAAWPLAVWLGDFRVIVVLIVAKAALGIVMSHLFARRPYRWSWRSELFVGIWTFGWPLLLNGLLIFASQQADQMLVGACFSLEALAPYALALSLVTIPGSIFAQVGSSLVLPLLARVQDDPPQFRGVYLQCLQYAGVVAILLTLPLIVAGEQMVIWVYGPKYADTGPLMAVLGAAAAIRFLRIVPAIASLARADTLNQLYSNLVRCASLPFAVIVVARGGGVIQVAACALAAELGAAVITLIRLHRRQAIPLGDASGTTSFVLGFVTLGVAAVFLGWADARFSLVVASGVMILALLSACLLFPAIPTHLRMLLSRSAEKSP